jgi:citrate lyase subunit beta/citryl-CoA lyase
MPGSNARALEKAKGQAADSLILDLEDAVAPDAKPVGRQQVCEAAASGEYGNREIAIRINGLDTEWGKADMEAAVKAAPDAILVPKIGSSAMIAEAVSLMKKHGAPEKTKLWAMMETPIGILRAEEIAGADPLLTVLVMGTNDIAKEVHCAQVPSRLPMMTSLQLCLLAARTHGKVIIDGVYNDIKNDDGFRAECEQGRELGFDGKTLIHPSQLEPCNDVFSPSEKEIEDARKIIAAFDEAQKAGKGVVTVDGRMIENLHVDNAQRTVAMAEAIAARQ